MLRNHTRAFVRTAVLMGVLSLFIATPPVAEAQAYPPVADGTFDITFVGDGYSTSTLDVFHDDVDRFKNALLELEPYKSRSSQIAFHYVDAQMPFPCYRTGNPANLTCSKFFAEDAVIQAGVPFDKVFVIVSTSTIGSSALPLGVAYNGPLGPYLFTREFQTYFANVSKETPSLSNGPITGNIDRNCLAGTPPTASWDHVGSVDYTLGCYYANWYRSSPHSVMNEPSYPYLNVLSQKMVNTRLESIIGSSTDAVAPTTSIISPADMANVGGTVAVTASASDDVGVAWVELWIDGAQHSTSYQSPYSFSWDTSSYAYGNHTLKTVAYDVAGNSSQSAITTVNKNDTIAPTTSITSPADMADVSGVVAVTTSSADNVGVDRVELWVDGVQHSTSNVAPFSFSWNTATSTYGNHTLKTVAYDAAGNSDQSATITVKKPDTTAPTTTITSPVNMANVSGTVAVTTSNSDNVGVSRVELWVDGSNYSTNYLTPFSFNWNTATSTYGNHTLKTVAYDAAGNSGQSATITVKKIDTVAPTVTLTAPLNGAQVLVNKPFTLKATASDNVGVSRVEFYVANVLTCSAATPVGGVYSCVWNVPSQKNKTYAIKAKAFDAQGNVGQSATSTVTSK